MRPASRSRSRAGHDPARAAEHRSGGGHRTGAGRAGCHLARTQRTPQHANIPRFAHRRCAHDRARRAPHDEEWDQSSWPCARRSTPAAMCPFRVTPGNGPTATCRRCWNPRRPATGCASARRMATPARSCASGSLRSLRQARCCLRGGPAASPRRSPGSPSLSPPASAPSRPVRCACRVGPAAGAPDGRHRRATLGDDAARAPALTLERRPHQPARPDRHRDAVLERERVPVIDEVVRRLRRRRRRRSTPGRCHRSAPSSHRPRRGTRRRVDGTQSGTAGLFRNSSETVLYTAVP